MNVLSALCLVALAQWRPTVDNSSRFPSELKAAQRAKVLASLDPLIPIMKAALDTQNVEFRAQRSFADEPQLPKGPWPMNLLVQGFEQISAGKFEGEAATNIDVFVNDLAPLLNIALDDPRTWVLKSDAGAFKLLSKGDAKPWKPVSQEEWARRIEKVLTKRRDAKGLEQLRADLAALPLDQRAAPMMLPKGHTADGQWRGFGAGVRPVVDLDPAYFDLSKRDAPQVLVLGGSVRVAMGHEEAVSRLKAFWKRLDYEALKGLLR